jgi:hypothetical protein
VGWEANNPNVINRNLGATGMSYGTSAVAARDILIDNRGWTINDDNASGDACDALLSTLDNELANIFSIYPNPTKDILNLVCEGEMEYSMSLYNSLGQMLMNTEFQSRQNNIDVSALNTGIYMLTIKTKSGQQSNFKFIKN